jgi:quercetin dioxygenase-like cupin family protein
MLNIIQGQESSSPDHHGFTPDFMPILQAKHPKKYRTIMVEIPAACALPWRYHQYREWFT